MIVFHVKRGLMHFFEDYLNSIVNKDPKKYAIRTDYKICKKNINIFVRKVPPIVHHILPKHKIYLLNTEQLTRMNKQNQIVKNDSVLLDLRNINNLIDYSEENVRVSPIKNTQFIPYQVNKKEIYNYKKTKNVAMIGIIQKRRKRIYDSIKHIDNVTGFGQSRDKRLFTYKILVNIHAGDSYKVCEQMRINRCIYNKMIVISENGLANNLVHLKDYIIFCKYEDIPNKVRDVLKNYDFYYKKIFGKFDLKKIDGQLTAKLNDVTKKLK